ncbi:MAG TPA: amidohydrolase [Candidatus Limnocylindria bacterium]|nr:amidohydrolase [Candidatus Limnocylindria bacterium]
MSRPRASLVVAGEVVVAAEADRLLTAEAIGIADGRVVSAGTRDEVLASARAGATLVDHGSRAVIPGMRDFHLHLVGMARARREVALDDAESGAELVERLRAGAAHLPPDAWLRGRGWRDPVMAGADQVTLDRAIGGRPALLYSHDGHSAWASSEALRRAGLDGSAADPPGGRLERDARGELSGVLRETATDLVEPMAERLGGAELARAVDETVAELSALGVTGVVDAGDSAPDGGTGPYAALGDRASALLSMRDQLEGRLRLSVNVPAAAIADAAELRLRTGAALQGSETLRMGWAKAFVDGALGSRTAALFHPYTCGPASQTGIPRLSPDELDDIIAGGRAVGISLAIHAIGDRGVADVLDAFERAGPRSPKAVPDRVEHLQLMRPADVPRLAALDVTASMQPVHCAADRQMMEACWADRLADAYPVAALQRAGARLAFGSDAPIETHNPWFGIFAAVHRRFPIDGTADWQVNQAIGAEAALSAYTSASAAAAGLADEGHLQPGARADLALLNTDVATLLRADGVLKDVRAELTYVGGREVHRA